MGYSLGGIDWEGTFIGELFGGHVRAVFSLITVIFIICVSITITSFAEIPLPLLEELHTDQDELNQAPPRPGSMKRHSEEIPITKFPAENNYGATATTIDKPRVNILKIILFSN